MLLLLPLLQRRAGYEDDKLPLDYPVRTALKIYGRRILILLIVVGVNLTFFAIWYLLSLTNPPTRLVISFVFTVLALVSGFSIMVVKLRRAVDHVPIILPGHDGIMVHGDRVIVSDLVLEKPLDTQRSETSGRGGRITRSTAYALLSVGYIAQHKKEPIILPQTISKECKIPVEYLLKIMQQLVRANILRSKRGPRGGFSLARPISEMTMVDIIEAIEGPMAKPLGLTKMAPHDKYAQKAEEACDEATRLAREYLEKITLSSLY